MSNELSKLFEFDGHQVRVVMIDGVPWFVARDVAVCLGYLVPHKSVNDHCKGDTKRIILTLGGPQEMRLIDRSDVFRLVIHSNMLDAVRFQDWVYEVVLPAIGEHGAYMTPATVEKVRMDGAFLRKLADDMDRLEDEKAAADDGDARPLGPLPRYAETAILPSLAPLSSSLSDEYEVSCGRHGPVAGEVRFRGYGPDATARQAHLARWR